MAWSFCKVKITLYFLFLEKNWPHCSVNNYNCNKKFYMKKLIPFVHQIMELNYQNDICNSVIPHPIVYF